LSDPVVQSVPETESENVIVPVAPATTVAVNVLEVPKLKLLYAEVNVTEGTGLGIAKEIHKAPAAPNPP
jgi:hypothetical protein